ncbi:MAG TPA: hypothetical protein VFP36_14865 [Usitatibacter sp.]|nr:hypothetical protein [Usitatibacter sp.]
MKGVLVALGVAAIVPDVHAAEAFAPAGARAVLTVEYLYASTGRKSSQGLYDPYEWRVKRDLSMEAQLTAQAPTPLPTVQPMDASHMAKAEGQAARMQGVTAQMAPMAMDIEKILARCGENEACVSREVQKMGNAMAQDPKQMAAMNAAKKEAQALAPGGMRYQAWRATAQKGTYAIDELVQVSVTDPICTSKPKHRCTREETRKGSGDVPMPAARSKGADAGISAVELDAQKGLLTIALPVPLAMLPYTETITSDEPDGTYDTPIARGARKREAFYRVSASGSGFMHDKPLTVALKGGWRDQAGEQVVKLPGQLGNGGTLTLRWRFKVQ